MMWHQIGQLLRDTGKLWSHSRANRMSAALAYYTVFALSPLLVIAVAIAGVVYGSAAAESEIVLQITQVAGAQVAEAVRGVLINTTQPGKGLIASTISVLVLFYGASNIFDHLQESLDIIWGVPHHEQAGLWPMLKRRVYAVGLVLAVGISLLVLLVLSTLIAAFGRFLVENLHPSFDLLPLLDLALSLILLRLIFAIVFKILPEGRVAWGDVRWGSWLTAVLFTVAKYAIGLYLGRTTITSAYGAAASLVVLLIWVYFAGQIFFLGAAFSKAYAMRFGSQKKREE